jgi:hypothetical protein
VFRSRNLLWGGLVDFSSVTVELTVDNPQTGTKLRLESDRRLERPQGDSVMRVQALGQDGGQVFDAAYVECDAQEADLIATLLHEAQYQSPQTQDRIAQEVQASFASRLSGARRRTDRTDRRALSLAGDSRPTIKPRPSRGRGRVRGAPRPGRPR